MAFLNTLSRLSKAERTEKTHIENVKDPTVQRIVHVDGPTILGWPAVQKNAPGMRLLHNVFAQLMDAGLIERLPIDPLIHLLWAALLEAGTYIGQADDSHMAEEEIASALLRIISGLRS